MKFEFAKYTEITDYAFKRNAEYQAVGYTRLFICEDVWNFHLLRVLPGLNEEYEEDENSILVELQEIDVNKKGERLTFRRLNEILDEDDFSNYDCKAFSDMESVIESIASIYGINNLKEEIES